MEDDERWDDLLTWYDDTAIEYDAYHNPKNWRNGMTLSWGNGSQLTAVGLTAGGAARYKYDASGARYEKTVGGVTTSYHLIDGVAYGEKRSDGVELQYLYDENGRVYGLRKGGILYYFLFNGQGDVIGIVDEYETLQCRYAYDAWGKVLSVKDASGAAITNATHIGNLNPFRYRGYYYDVETGFYYLNSRYYDPTVKRFLNADSLVGITNDVATYNLYVYCGNNPISRDDSSGHFWKEVGNFFSGIGDAISSGWNKLTNSISSSVSVDASVGAGIGVKKNTGIGNVEAAFVPIATEWGYDARSKKTYKSDKSSLSIKKELTSSIWAGVDATYSAPTTSTRRPDPILPENDQGLIMNPDASWSGIFGLCIGSWNAAIPFEEPVEQRQISFGVGAYFILGGEVNISFDVNAFKRAWEGE